MNKSKVDEILSKCIKVWESRGKVDADWLATFRRFLGACPDDDGFKRVTRLESGKTYLVPYEYIILNGLKEEELDKFEQINSRVKK